MELASHAVQTGADAIASIAPSFFKPGMVDELVDFLHRFAGPPVSCLSIIIICRQSQGLTCR